MPGSTMTPSRHICNRSDAVKHTCKNNKEKHVEKTSFDALRIEQQLPPPFSFTTKEGGRFSTTVPSVHTLEAL